MTGVHVGAAKVLAIEGDGRPRVQLLTGSCEQLTASWALPFRYVPQVGDLLLVLGQIDRYWVTGIVQGDGRSELAFRGDLTVHADKTMHVGGDGGVRLHAPTVVVATETFEATANHVQERADEHDTEVRGTIDERAGTSERIIDEDDEVTAARHSTVAGRCVRIDGDLLRLS
ncbi:MAG: hypothetical protein KAI24_02340 [Planctomycetes bacterium]|nr:hypothetical protein [Planctomycetota bacterium]